MSRFITILTIIILMLICPTESFCEDSSDYDYKIKLIPTKKKTGERPNESLKQKIQCSLNDSNIILDFSVSEGLATVTIDEIDNVSEYVIDTSVQSYILVNRSDFEKITITTEYGNTYEGYIQL